MRDHVEVEHVGVHEASVDDRARIHVVTAKSHSLTGKILYAVKPRLAQIGVSSKHTNATESQVL